MANDITGNPWVLDTAAANTDVWTGPMVEVKQVIFSGYAVASDLCELTDSLGKRICLLTGAADLSEVRTGDIGWVRGVRVKQLTVGTTGKILVYLAMR